jgi:hypothetical protein
MGPIEDPATQLENQPRSRGPRPAGRGPERRALRPRQRLCLLKGCEQAFRPKHPLTRYCSAQCREQARQWREWKARQRYRQSQGGKQRRQAQSRRYRRRQQAGKTRKIVAVKARLYWENKFGFFNIKGVSVPAAVSVFPDEQYQTPRSWAERAYPKLIHYNKARQRRTLRPGNSRNPFPRRSERRSDH